MRKFIEMICFLLFPWRCEKCFSREDFPEEMDSINGIACEYQEVCWECGHIKRYWAYGYYDKPHDLDFWNRLEYVREVMIYE